MSKEVTNRFSDRVENYVKYRPAYPGEFYEFLFSEGIVNQESHVADIGAGTGIFAEPLLAHGLKVTCVEPNKEMREAAEQLLSKYPLFYSKGSTAEKTEIENNSIDAILVGQAFHWFDREKCKTEFKRILQPEGKVILVWNDRRTDSTDFLKVYEDFLQMFGTDYKNVNHKNIQDKKVFDDFFGEGKYNEKWFYNFQDVDFSGLKGRVLSASYMPNESHPDYEHMIYCLKKIFMRYQENGKVRLEYDTKMYWGN
jgi:SAM-dependent methyltransferase